MFTHILFNRHAVKPVTASDLYDRYETISTSLPALDRFLHSEGIVRGEMMEFCGSSECGKSLLCHVLSASVASQNLDVVYLNTSNTFSLKTLRMASKWIWSEQKSILKLNQFEHNVLSRVRCATTYELTEAFVTLRNIDRMYSSSSSSSSLGMIVVDSVTPLLSSLIGGTKSGIGFASMMEFATSLKMLAHKHNTAIIVTNGTVSANLDSNESDNRTRKPALGRTWESVPSTRVWMERIEEYNSTSSSFRTVLKCLKSTRMSEYEPGTKPCIFQFQI